VLTALLDAEGNALTQRDLMSSVKRTSGTVSVRLARLERAGLVTREPDAEDRRTVTVTLTDRGREWAEAARPAYEAAAARLAAGLPTTRAPRSPRTSTRGRLLRARRRRGAAPRHRGRAGSHRLAHAPRRRPADRPGILVLKVKRQSVADEAGITRGDLVTKAADQDVRTIGDLHRALRHAKGALKLDVVRGVEERSVEVALSRSS